MKKLQDQDILENTQVVFECELNKPNVPVEWLFNDQPIEKAFDIRSYIVSESDTKYCLTIPKCQMNNQGVFTINLPMHNLRSKALLGVDEAQAEFLIQIKDKTVNEEESVEFMCEVNKFNVKVKWSINGERCVANENVKLISEENKRILKIKSCQLNDAGTVTCTLPGDRSTNAQLTVLENPIDIKLEPIEVFENEDARLDAILSKVLGRKDVSWEFKAKKLTDSIKYNLENDREFRHSLIVRECSLEDAGEYFLKARNSSVSVKLTVKELPCKFGKGLKDQNPTEHDSVSFDVVLTKPNHSVKWYLNGKEIENDARFTLSNDKNRFKLDFNDVRLEDDGILKCVLFNDKGDQIDSCECSLAVKEIPLRLEKGLTSLRCTEKDEVKFECKLNREVKSDDVQWFKDGQRVLPDEDKIQIISDGSNQYLVIKNANLEDTGSYDIRIKGVKSTGSLKVKEEPVTFVRPLKETYECVEKETLTLECEVSKEVKCVWKRYGKAIEVDGDRVKIETDGRVQRLIIKNASMSDKQSISCVAIRGRNEDDELASTSARIVVKEGPLEVVKGLEDTGVKEGSDGLLQVELNRPNEEVEWYKDGVKLRSDINHRIYSNNNIYYLRVNDANPDRDSGVYTFKIKDLESSGKLSVEEKPIEILSSLKDKNCVENQTVKFEIELNKPDLANRLTWFKNDEEIKLDSNDYELKAVGQKYALIIKKAKFEDEAKYTVKIKNTDLSDSANLSVEEAPLEFVRPLTEIELKENKTAIFECELNRDGEKVKWFKNGEPIEPDGKHVIVKADGKVHQLIIKNCDPNDAAKYSAKTSGPSSSAHLYIEGKILTILY